MIATLAFATALAGPDVDLTSMVDQDGEPVFDTDLLADAYDQLIREVGAMVSNKPFTPARTTGLAGFEMNVSTWWVLTDARNRTDISPWARASADEDSEPFAAVPVLAVRKGLPLSTEVGGQIGWIGGTDNGIAGVWGRVGILEGFRPLPEITGHVGYSGYLGNDGLEVGVLDFGLTLGTTLRSSNAEGHRAGAFSPWFDVSSLRVSAAPILDEALADDIGAIPYGGSKTADHAPALVLAQFGAGIQATVRDVHLRVGLAWVPEAIPSLTTGVGFTL